MTLDELYNKYSEFTLKQKIVISCDCNGCDRKELTRKSSAIVNIKNNDRYMCRSCAYTKEGKEKIAQATSYKRSDATKKRMSEKKKAFYETEKGKKNKKMLSALTAQGHVTNKYKKNRRTGFWLSPKTGKPMFYGSSYEMRLCYILDNDDTVLTYQTQIGYICEDRSRCLDFLVTFHNGLKKVIEVKPASRLNEEKNISQINDGRTNAISQGWSFEVYTEENFGMTGIEIRKWADEIRSKTGNFDYTQHRKDMACERVKKYYKEKNCH